MEDIDNQTIAYTVIVLDHVDGGRLIATIGDSSKVTINMSHGRLKIHVGDDYITGSFSGNKQEATDARGRYRIWRECHFGEVTMPELSETTVIGIEGVRYEIHITMHPATTSSGQKDEVHMSRGAMFFRMPHSDIVERFVPHVCSPDCIRECPTGVWTREL